MMLEESSQQGLEAELLELIKFTKSYAFLYAKLNVEFFASRIYEQIDTEWLNFMSRLPMAHLNRLPLDFDQYADCPKTLTNFFSRCLSLSLCQKYSTKFHPNGTEPAPKLTKVRAKKAHELGILVEFIQRECHHANVDRIVDIGCGLGHLGRFLKTTATKTKKSNETQGWNIDYVGIEANKEFCHSGQKICDGLKLENIRFGPETIDQCRQILTDRNHKTAIVSLHGCGELQRLILAEFTKLAKEYPDMNPLLITVGCCYHKIGNWENTAVERWMLSQTMQRIFKQIYGPFNGFPIPGLRLACQAKLSRWILFTDEEHRRHQQSFANRALVECFNTRKEYGTELQIRPRKLNRKMGISEVEFRDEVIRRIECPTADSKKECQNTLDQLISDHLPAMSYIEPFTALQFALQAPMESLVILDRFVYLKEHGLNIEMIELFDPVISPRNICLIARV